MNNYDSTVPFVSATTPGVSGVVRKLSWGARNDLRAKLADAYDKQLDLSADRSDLLETFCESHGKNQEDLLIADLTVRERAKLEKVSNRLELLVDREIHQPQLEMCFVSLDGITIDGAPVTKDNVAQLPPVLAQELVAAILAASELEGTAAKNSPSPSTSGGVEQSATNTSIAASADAPGIIEPASAASTPS